MLNGDTKVGLVILVLVIGVGLSYYATYQYGKRATYKALTPILMRMTEETYAEGYSDGKKQAQFDCVNGLIK